MISKILFYMAAFILITYFKVWREFTMYWLVPFGTWLNMVAHIRSISEHFSLPSSYNSSNRTRTLILSFFEKLFLIPNNINYHIEHHLYPSVPFYRLPEIHNFLMHNFEYREKSHITYNFRNLVEECTRL